MPLTVPVPAFPLAISNGEFLLVEQDSAYDVDGALEALVRCPLGYLDSLPEMGVPDWVLTRGAPSLDALRESLVPYDRRIAVVADSRLADGIAEVTIDRQRGASA